MDKYREAVPAEMNGLVYQGALVSELLREVRRDVEEFEWGKVAEKVEEIIRGME